MTEDEKIQIERMKEWNDTWCGPAPLCKPQDRKIEGSERPSEKKEETWRDRPPLL